MSWKKSLKQQLEQRRQGNLLRQRRTLSSPQGRKVVLRKDKLI